MIGRIGFKYGKGTVEQTGPMEFDVYPTYDPDSPGPYQYRLQPMVTYSQGGNFKIDWGNGLTQNWTDTSPGVGANDNQVLGENYSDPGPYRVRILEFNETSTQVGREMKISTETIAFNGVDPGSKAGIDFKKWGGFNLGGTKEFFSYINNDFLNAGGVSGSNSNPCELIYSADDSPSLESNSTLYGMFLVTDFSNPTTSLLNNLNISNATNMRKVFRASNFDGNISSWDVSNGNDFQDFFNGSDFSGNNSNINSWDVSSATNMNEMFQDSPFDQPLNSWDTSNVSNMDYMFNACIFDHDISNWCVPNISSRPANFSQEITSGDPFEPKWGTCP